MGGGVVLVVVVGLTRPTMIFCGGWMLCVAERGVHTQTHTKMRRCDDGDALRGGDAPCLQRTSGPHRSQLCSAALWFCQSQFTGMSTLRRLRPMVTTSRRSVAHTGSSRVLSESPNPADPRLPAPAAAAAAPPRPPTGGACGARPPPPWAALPVDSGTEGTLSPNSCDRVHKRM